MFFYYYYKEINKYAISLIRPPPHRSPYIRLSSSSLSSLSQQIFSQALDLPDSLSLNNIYIYASGLGICDPPMVVVLSLWATHWKWRSSTRSPLMPLSLIRLSRCSLSIIITTSPCNSLSLFKFSSFVKVGASGCRLSFEHKHCTPSTIDIFGPAGDLWEVAVCFPSGIVWSLETSRFSVGVAFLEVSVVEAVSPVRDRRVWGCGQGNAWAKTAMD